MKRAVLRDAAQSQQFYFRKSFTPEDEEEVDSSKPKSHDHEYTLMDTNTIINGKVNDTNTHHPAWHCYVLCHFFTPFLQDEFPGILSLVRMYVNSIDMDVDTRCTVLQYLRFISKRASGWCNRLYSVSTVILFDSTGCELILHRCTCR